MHVRVPFCGLYPQAPNDLPRTNWTVPRNAWSIVSNRIWLASRPPFLPQHFAIAPFQLFRQDGYVPVCVDFGARALRQGSRFCRGAADFDRLPSELRRIVSQGAKLTILPRETLGAHRGRDHGDSA